MRYGGRGRRGDQSDLGEMKGISRLVVMILGLSFAFAFAALTALAILVIPV